MQQWWNGLTQQQKARYVSHGLVGLGFFALGTKVKGAKAGVALGVGSMVGHQLLDVPLAVLLLNLGLF